MKYLLDTQVIIWFFHEDKRLGSKTKQLITDTREDIGVSYISVWEVAIKTSLNKIRMKRSFKEYIQQSAFLWLPLQLVHIEQLTALPHLHGDPFDRLLISQCVSENLTLITADTKILQYPGISLIDARK